MTQIVGGIRMRLIKQSLYNMLNDALSDLGWFDSGRNHKEINFRTAAVKNDEEIPMNTLVLTTEDWTAIDGEMGSNFEEFSWTCYLDFYAESDGVGLEMAGDLYDVVAGRMSSIGRGRTTFPVYDYRQSTPTVAFYCDLEEPILDRAHDFPKPWQQHWFAVRFMLADAYGDDSGS